MTETITHAAQVPDAMRGTRFDQCAAALFPDYSRARLQGWIKTGELLVNGQVHRPRHKLLGGERLTLEAQLVSETHWQAEDLPVDIVYEDEHLLVVNKAAGRVVHPAAGNYSGTLVNALLYHRPALAGLPRAGIVHRLDKDTTGLMVVAKTLPAHTDLVAQLQARSVSREYQAIVVGTMTGGGKVETMIGRHPKQRKQMAVVTHAGKEAITHYRVLKRFDAHMHLRLKLETGRTHQIRVHMAHIHHPLVGDPLYGQRFRRPPGASEALAHALRTFSRQALHAAQLGLLHPVSGEPMQWSAPLPEDMTTLLQALEEQNDERH